MKTAIIYYSKHHGNTKKLLDAIAGKYEVTLIDVTQNEKYDLSGYDRIGIASGIYYSSFAKPLLLFTEKYLPEKREVFFIYTHGAPKGGFLNGIREITNKKNSKEIGAYHCLGYDTFGPFKIVGGIAKGHPTNEEIAGAIKFYEGLGKGND